MVGEFLHSFIRNGLGMAEDPDRYEQYASECLRIAQQTDDAAQKARLLEMAAAWRRLAEAAAKRNGDNTRNT
jgi:hypothetical protein